MTHKNIVSLCDYSSYWAWPYIQQGYNVFCVDTKKVQIFQAGKLLTEQPGLDVRSLRHSDFAPVHGVLAAPPCTMFATTGNRWRAEEKKAGTFAAKIVDALSIVDACMRFSIVSGAQWWALENPVGTLHNYLGPPIYTFQPHEFAGGAEEERYTKRTLMWGYFNKDLEKRTAPPALGSIMKTKMGSSTEKKKGLRSRTPLGFALSFYMANPQEATVEDR